MNESEIINQIRNGAVDEPIRVLYREFPKVRALIGKAGGSSSEARETFHDALILLIEKVQDPGFKLTAKITTYLYGINRYLWLNKSRKKQKHPEVEWTDTLIISNEDLGWDESREAKLKLLENILNDISARCRELFSRFYTRMESMAEIAAAMGFSGLASAKTQKYKCMEQALKRASVINQKNA